MKKTLAHVGVVAALGLWFNAASTEAQDVRAPYLQLGTTDGVTVVWRSSAAVPSVVCYGAATNALTQTASVAGNRTHHEVRIKGLTPGSRTYYAVTTGSCPPASAGDAEHYYDAAPPVGSTGAVRLWLVGDSGTGGSAQKAVRDAMLTATSTRRPDLFLHVGDMAYNDGTTAEFDAKFFAIYQDILRNTVVWPALGNHEGHSASSAAQSGPYYEAYVLPTDGSAGGMPSGTEAYYSFDYANVHFIVLDSHDSPRTPQGAMLQWLEQDLAATDQQWLIAYFHHPPYTKGSHDSDLESDSAGRLIDMRENALPILEAAGVDLVLGGHSHIYERSFLISGAYATPTTAEGHILDDGDGRPAGDGAYQKAAAGAVYVVAGHGGTGLGGPGGHPVMFFDEKQHGSCLIDIEGPELRLTNLRADGTESDWFTLRRDGSDAPQPVETQTLIPFGAIWEYFDQGDPGPTWKTGSGTWSKGPAQLGYGDGDEATLLEKATPGRPSAYFRTRFELPSNAELVEAELQVLYDDGVAVFLNGEPLWAANTTADPDYASFATAQSADNERATRRFDLRGQHAFVAGTNTLAAIVKQNNAASSDLSFDLQLRISTRVVDPPPPDSDGGNGGSNGSAGNSGGSSGPATGSSGEGSSSAGTSGDNPEAEKPARARSGCQIETVGGGPIWPLLSWLFATLSLRRATLSRRRSRA